MIVPGTTPIADPSRRSSCFYSGLPAVDFLVRRLFEGTPQGTPVDDPR